MSDVIFSVLGGGQEIGASSYCLTFDNKSVLLDCGRGVRNNVGIVPDFTCLNEIGKTGYDIENVFISHAHFDHIGFAPYLKDVCGNVPIYTSRLTAALGKALLLDNMYLHSAHSCIGKSLLEYQNGIESRIVNANTVEFFKTLDFGSYKVTFFEAGHVPGAAMIYIETPEKTILFTGDFSAERTALTNGVMLPEDFKADVVIIDGTNAKRPYTRKSGILNKFSRAITADDNKPIGLRVNQLSKGIEVVNKLREQIDKGIIPKGKIFIGDEIWNVAQAFSEVGIQSLDEKCFPLDDANYFERSKAYIVSAKEYYGLVDFETVDFPLHADFETLKRFALRHAREKVVVVHSPNFQDRDFFALQNECGFDLRFEYPVQGEHIRL